MKGYAESLKQEAREHAHRVCLQMNEFHWQGNIVPHFWYRNLVLSDGKPNLVAITMLSDVCYWYRPREVRDQTTGQVRGYMPRFKGRKLQRSHSYFEKAFGLSKKQSRAGVAFLEERELIFKQILPRLQLPSGEWLSNVMYLEANPALIKTVSLGLHSFPKYEEGMPCRAEGMPCRAEGMPCRADIYRELDKDLEGGNQIKKQNSPLPSPRRVVTTDESENFESDFDFPDSFGDHT